MSSTTASDPSQVFVVHGRNTEGRDAVFQFLRAIRLNPIEWAQAVKLTGVGAPYIGQVLDEAFAAAQAVVVLLTPDDIAYLRGELAPADDPDVEPKPQARPNVLFEAGMAFGRHPEQTIIVEFGKVRPFSDVAGRHAIRLDGSAESRKELAQRLQTAGCSVDLSGSDWLSAGNLTPPSPPGGGLPLGRRLPSSRPAGVRLDARYIRQGTGGRLQITNHSPFDIYDLDIEVPEEAKPGFAVHTSGELPLKKLPSGKTVSLVASRNMGPGASHFDITVTGKTPDGDPIREEVFISLTG